MCTGVGSGKESGLDSLSFFLSLCVYCLSSFLFIDQHKKRRRGWRVGQHCHVVVVRGGGGDLVLLLVVAGSIHNSSAFSQYLIRVGYVRMLVCVWAQGMC